MKKQHKGYEMSEVEIIKIAKSSSDRNTLSELSNHNSPMVRRVVAKNSYTPEKILEKLSYDPVMNVSFIAVNNHNNKKIQRQFEESHPCVICNQDELLMNCTNCNRLQSYKVS